MNEKSCESKIQERQNLLKALLKDKMFLNRIGSGDCVVCGKPGSWSDSCCPKLRWCDEHNVKVSERKKPVHFEFDLGEVVDVNSLGIRGIIDMQGVDGGGKTYHIQTDRKDGWFAEDMLSRSVTTGYPISDGDGGKSNVVE